MGKGIFAAVIAAASLAVAAEPPPIREALHITSPGATTWLDDGTSVVAFESPVEITLDGVKMSASSAVMWISPAPGIVPDLQVAEFALLGDAVLEQGEARRTGDRLFVTARVRGPIQMQTPKRITRNQSADALYQSALVLRDQSGMAISSTKGQWRMPMPSPMVEMPRTRIATTSATPVSRQVRMSAEAGYSARMPDGTLATIVDKGLSVTIRSGTDQVTQLLADRGVVFSTLKSISTDDHETAGRTFDDAIESVYLEGDVRIIASPSSPERSSSTLEADRVFYEIATDRAVLTNAVIHTMDPGASIPIIMRARTIKQLSRDDNGGAEYRLKDAVLTTSSFSRPSYAVAADRTYVKQVETDQWFGTRTSFAATSSALDLWGLPVLWLPYSGGAITERGFPLRSLDIGSSGRYGFFTRTQWGLFETIGRAPPRDLDLSYRADYLASRGPAGGLDGEYRGWRTSETTGEPNSYFGALKSYVILDSGKDEFGAARRSIEPDDTFRGRLRWEHQQFLPDDWQVQVRSGWISDPTFLEEYFPDEYRGIDPLDSSLYVKRQRDTESVSMLVSLQPNDVVSSQEFAQENLEIERFPELAYSRVGDALGDRFTFYSSDTISRLGYQRNEATFAEMGHVANPNHPYAPGLPVEGSTGTTGKWVNRGDFRQEIAAPFTIDRYRVQPYVMARYTGYDNSPDDSSVNRVASGVGMRVSTQLWQTHDSVESEIWDVHRLRHVIEPELHVFGSASGTDRDEVYVFDEPIDQINDITAMQVAVRQRWQTKRGGPGRWHNVDFFTFNADGTFYGNKPDDEFREPVGFRGLFFPSAPETSIVRDALNLEQTWRISNSTLFIADQQYNLDESQMATHSVGVAVRRGSRMTYYVGDRYINELNSNIVSFVMNYELSTRYTLGLNQSYDFGEDQGVTSRVSAVRRFDRFSLIATMSFDDRTGDTGFFVSVRPDFLPPGVGNSVLPGLFGQ